MHVRNETQSRQQRIRRRQVLTGLAVYLTALVPLAWIDALGMLHLTADERIFLVIAALLTNVVFYALIRLDLNLHFRDPSMTFVQVTAATAWSLAIAWNVAQPARLLAVVWYLLAFLFGFYTLKRWQFMVLALFALAGYAAVVVRAYVDGGATAFRIEVLHWLVLAAGLLWMSLVGGYVSALRERLARQRRALADAAFVDPLTQVYNRRYLFDLLERELARIRREHVAMLSVAMIGIDDAGTASARQGVAGRDRMLHRVADLLKDELRTMDAVGRFDTASFIVVMPDTDGAGAGSCMERARRRIASDDSPFRRMKTSVTVSIGIAQARANEQVAALVERAGEVLRAAGQAGGNRVVVAQDGRIDDQAAAPEPRGAKPRRRTQDAME